MNGCSLTVQPSLHHGVTAMANPIGCRFEELMESSDKLLFRMNSLGVMPSKATNFWSQQTPARHHGIDSKPIVISSDSEDDVPLSHRLNNSRRQQSAPSKASPTVRPTDAGGCSQTTAAVPTSTAQVSARTTQHSHHRTEPTQSRPAARERSQSAQPRMAAEVGPSVSLGINQQEWNQRTHPQATLSSRATSVKGLQRVNPSLAAAVKRMQACQQAASRQHLNERGTRPTSVPAHSGDVHKARAASKKHQAQPAAGVQHTFKPDWGAAAHAWQSSKGTSQLAAQSTGGATSVLPKQASANPRGFYKGHAAASPANQSRAGTTVSSLRKRQQPAAPPRQTPQNSAATPSMPQPPRAGGPCRNASASQPNVSCGAAVDAETAPDPEPAPECSPREGAAQAAAAPNPNAHNDPVNPPAFERANPGQKQQRQDSILDLDAADPLGARILLGSPTEQESAMPTGSDRASADEAEWRARRLEIERQAEEARRLKKRKRAEAQIADRAQVRLEQHRQSQAAQESALLDREDMRSRIREGLNIRVAGKRSLLDVLITLGIQVEGIAPAKVAQAYKKALLYYHPDRHVSASLEQQLYAEEVFKIISQAANQNPR